MQKVKRILLLFLLMAVSARFFAQTHNFKFFNVEDGLAQSQVFALYQDNKGYLWFGTNGGGVSVYDGMKFMNYTTKNGLVSNYVFSITQNKKGDVFLATYDGLSVYNGFSFKNYTEKEKMPSNATFSVYTDRKDKVWIGTQKGVCTLENGKIVPFTTDTMLADKAVFTIFEDAAGNMWFGTMRNGAVKYNPGTKKLTSYSAENGKLGVENFVRSFNEDHKGNVYIGTIAGCYIISPADTKTNINIKNQHNYGFTSIIRDNQNVMWLGTEGIVKYANDKIVNYFDESKGLLGKSVLCALQDREGNYWFGTNGFGVAKLTSEMFTNYSPANGLPGEYIHCVFEDSKKNIWIGVSDQGVVRLKDNAMTMFSTTSVNKSQKIIDKNVHVVREDKNGNIWFGTQAGISCYNGSSINNYTIKQGLMDTSVYSLYIDRNNIVWAGTHNGLYAFDGSRFNAVELVNSAKTGKEDAPIYSIYEDKNHALWLSGNKGVIKYQDNKVTLFGAAQGFIDQSVFCTLQDPGGNYWFSSESGIYRYDGKAFKNINDTMGLSSNQVYLLQMDDKNNLWIGTNNGLDKLSLTEYNSSGKIDIKHYGKEEGLKGLECNMNAGMHDQEGNLWFGTIKGVTVYNPHFDKINYKEPLTHITSLRLFFEHAELSEYSEGVDSTSRLPINMVLPYSKNHVTFDFIGICEANPSKVLYSFKLEGADENWSPPSSRNDATYSSLQPGKYTFLLKAMNNDGIWNEVPVAFKFTVEPPWYRTWWFYSLCVVIVIASVYFYNSYKTKKLTQDKLKLEKEVQLRTRELREEKEKVELVNKEVIEQKAIIEHKNSEITDSIKYAKDIQQALLPAKTLLSKDIPDSFLLYMPKDIVSGDFYWFAKRDGKNYFASCDCTGHGVPGAFMSIVGNSLLNEIVAEQNVFQPAAILNHLDSGVKTALNHNKGEQERRDGMDIALCAINKETLMLEYAGANRPLWIFRKDCEGECEIVKPDKFAIGGIDLEQKHPFTPHEIQLYPGDVLYTFSDGYADQFGGDRGKKMMVGNLQKLLAQIYIKPMDEQREILIKHFNNWKGEHEQIDDVLVIGVRV
ncbi:MAG: rsbU 7 [Bacteroidetes bacterium]|jgi:ligand-binding sensor domain-containing protein/serine phosphatase RsbU (regulator of sigma subunit)|nr:rsbU 7 [Bacteroidota bacterium]